MSKRKLKQPYKRKPKERVSLSKMVKEVEIRTGFKSCDINLVINTFLDIAIETFLDKKAVYIKKIGTLYPFIRPSRAGMSMNGMARVIEGGIRKVEGKKIVRIKEGTEISRMTIPPRWVLKITPSKNIVSKFLRLPISKEELDNIYERE